MFFRPVIELWGVEGLASALDLPRKNVRRWVDNDSIPAEWFAAIARLERRVDGVQITNAYLAELAEARRLSKRIAA